MNSTAQQGVVWDITPVEGRMFFGIFSESSNATGECFGNNPDRWVMLFLRKVENGCNKMGWQS